MAGGHPNLYLYCANDPVNGKDPSGLQRDDPPDAGIIEFDERGHPLIYKEVQKGINSRIAAPLRGFATVAAEMHPYTGFVEAAYGSDCSGAKLSVGQRFLGALPVIGGLTKVGRAAQLVRYFRDRGLDVTPHFLYDRLLSKRATRGGIIVTKEKLMRVYNEGRQWYDPQRGYYIRGKIDCDMGNWIFIVHDKKGLLITFFDAPTPASKWVPISYGSGR